MLVILACGLPRLRAVATRGALLQVSGLPDDGQDPIANLGGHVGAVLHKGGTIVAVLPSWADEPTRRHLQTVRSAFDTTRLVVHTTDLPPLAAAAFAGLLADCAEHTAVTPSALVTGMQALERRVVGAAWLGSVAKLTYPAPSLKMHARSWLPRSAFGAIIDDDPRVETLSKDTAATIPLPAPDPAGSQVLMAIGQGDVARVERSLVTQLPDAPVTRSAISPISQEWWGTERLIELAVRPSDVDTLVRELVTDAPMARCSWCDSPTNDLACPFCHMQRTAVVPAAPFPGGSE